jgi:hypothetical protein
MLFMSVGSWLKSHRAHSTRKGYATTWAALATLALLIILGPDFSQARQQSSSESIEHGISLSLEQGANKQASADLDQLLAQPLVDSNLLLRLGIAFAQKGLYSEASRAFTRVVRDHSPV